MPTSTFRPSPDAATSTFDGIVQNSTSGSQTFSQLVTGNGDFSSGSDTVITSRIHSNATPLWADIIRAILLFDTSSLPDGATITSATLNLYCTFKLDDYTDSLAVVASAPASNTAVANGDYQTMGTTLLAAAVPFSSFSTGAYKAISLNATGLAAISKTGVTKLGLRNESDRTDVEPTLVANKFSQLDFSAADETGTSQGPYLEVTYQDGDLTDDEASEGLPRRNPIVTRIRPNFFTNDLIGPVAVTLGTDQEEPWIAQRTVQPWLARTFHDQEEARIEFPYNDHDEPWRPFTTAQPWLSRPFNDTDVLVPTLHLDVDEPANTPTTAWPWLSRPFLDDEFSTNLTHTPYDIDEPFVPYTTLISWTASPFLDDEFSTNLAYFPYDIDEPFTPFTTSILWLSRPFLDDEFNNIANQNPYLDTDTDQPFIPFTTRLTWLSLPFTDDEISTNLAYFFNEQEEPWLAFVTSQPWTARPHTDDDLYAAPQIYDIDEPWIDRTTRLPWTAQPHTYDEIGSPLAYFYTDQEEPWIACTTAQPWTARTFYDDGDRVAVPDDRVDDTDCWTTNITAQPWTARPFFADEISTDLHQSYLNHEEPWTPLTTAQPWQARPYESDETGLPHLFLWAHDEPYTAYITSVPWLSRPFSDNEAGNQPLYLLWEETDPPSHYTTSQPRNQPLYYYDDQIVPFATEDEGDYPSLLRRTSSIWIAAPALFDRDHEAYVVYVPPIGGGVDVAYITGHLRMTPLISGHLRMEECLPIGCDVDLEWHDAEYSATELPVDSSSGVTPTAYITNDTGGTIPGSSVTPVYDSTNSCWRATFPSTMALTHGDWYYCYLRLAATTPAGVGLRRLRRQAIIIG